jgi:zinc transport system substrate-binding protein
MLLYNITTQSPTMKHLTPLLLLACLLTPLSGHGSASGSEGGILASIRPLALITAEIAGDSLPVTTLLPDNADPHHYSLPPSGYRQLKQAKLVIWLGKEVEPWIRRGAPADRQLALLDTLLGEGESNDDHHHDHHHGHAHDRDPHIWLDPALAVSAAQLIHQRLVELHPDKAALLDNNLSRFIEDTTRLDTTLADMLKPLETQTFISHHNAYARLFGHYGLFHAGAIEQAGGLGSSLKHLDELKQVTDSSAAKPCLLVEARLPEKQVARLKAQWKLVTVPMDIMGREAGNYRDLLMAVGRQLTQCAPGSRPDKTPE